MNRDWIQAAISIALSALIVFVIACAIAGTWPAGAQTIEVRNCLPPECVTRVIIRREGQPDVIYTQRGDGRIVVPTPPGTLVVTSEGSDIVVTVR
jgi:hypothetical protein